MCYNRFVAIGTVGYAPRLWGKTAGSGRLCILTDCAPKLLGMCRRSQGLYPHGVVCAAWFLVIIYRGKVTE